MTTSSQPGDLEFFEVDAVVHAGASPAVLTDLDISAVVGTRIVRAVIRMAHAIGVTQALTCRRNGDIEDPTTGGISGGVCPTGHFIDYSVATDANGILEWRNATSNGNVTVTVKNFSVATA